MLISAAFVSAAASAAFASVGASAAFASAGASAAFAMMPTVPTVPLGPQALVSLSFETTNIIRLDKPTASVFEIGSTIVQNVIDIAIVDMLHPLSPFYDDIDIDFDIVVPFIIIDMTMMNLTLTLKTRPMAMSISILISISLLVATSKRCV